MSHSVKCLVYKHFTNDNLDRKYSLSTFADRKDVFLENNKLLKLSRNKKYLNDVTAAPFLVSFSQLPAAKKHPKRGSCGVIKVLLIS